MTDAERIEAERKAQRINREEDEEMRETKRIGKRIGLLKLWLDPFMDSFTKDIWYEYMAHQNVDDYKMPIVVSVLYVLALTFICFLLSKICRTLPPVFCALVWYTSTTMAAFPLTLTLYWFMSRIYVYSVGNVEVREGLVTPWTEVRNTKRDHLVWGWLDPTVLNILVIIAVACFVSQYNVALAGLVGMGILAIMVRMIPGVGGNSTASLLAMVALAIMAILVTPPVFSLVLEYMKDKSTPMAPSGLGYVGVARTVVDGLSTKETLEAAVQPDPSSYIDISRVLLGNILMFWVAMDDWKGPGRLLEMASQLRLRRELAMDGMASIDSGVVWMALAAQIGLELCSRSMLNLALKGVSFVIAQVLWKKFGSGIWTGRGQAATFVEGRPGCEVSIGEGPRGRRLLMARISLCIVMGLFYYLHQSNIGVGLSFINFICMAGPERWTGLALGAMTFNWSLVILSLFSDKPFTGSLDKSMRDAYSPGVGTHST